VSIVSLVFLHPSFQLAYYRLYGELRMTYETVMTKMFDHGRTEAQRSCTPEVRRGTQTACLPFAPLLW
jgi:hypothetical protein